MVKTKSIVISRYNDLSKIYDIKTNALYKIIPSPNYYYNFKQNCFVEIIDKKTKKNILKYDYSILGFDYNNNKNNKNIPSLIKQKTGYIVLKIPYLKLIKLYKE